MEQYPQKSGDSLRLYLQQIGEVPLLTKDDEVEIGASMERGLEVLSTVDFTKIDPQYTHFPQLPRTDEQIEAVLGQLDEAQQEIVLNACASRKRLYKSNLRLVVSVAKKYTRGGKHELLDLIQEGNISLESAVNQFDYKKGFKFSTYATWWIRQGITRSIAKDAGLIQVPTKKVEQLASYKRINAAHMQFNEGNSISDEEAADKLNMSVEGIRELQAIQATVVGAVSLDRPLGEEGDTTLGDLVPSAAHHEDLLENFGNKERIYQLFEASSLPEADRELLIMRFGIEDGTPRTLNEVGQHYGVTRERIRQREQRALLKLQHAAGRISFDEYSRGVRSRKSSGGIRR